MLSLTDFLSILLHSSPGHTRSLLHNLVHLPIAAFRDDIVTIATHCWQWLITARGDLEYLVKF